MRQTVVQNPPTAPQAARPPAVWPASRSIQQSQGASHESIGAAATRWLTPHRADGWDDALAQSAQDCPFLRAAWLRVLSDVTGWRISLLAVVDKGRLVAGLIGRSSQSHGSSTLDRIPLIPYTGIWITRPGTGLPHRAQRRTARWLTCLAGEARRSFRSVTIETHPATRDVRPFTWNHWRAEGRYTYVSRLSEDIESGCDADVRRRARKAEAAGARFTETIRPDEFERLWRLTCARQAVVPDVTPGVLAALLAELSRVCCLRICGARLADGRLAAANVVLYQSEAAYYWLAAFDHAVSPTGCNPFCTTRTLREAARRARRFDWIGANTPGVADYKQSFNPDLVPYYRLTWRAPNPVRRRGLMDRLFLR